MNAAAFLSRSQVNAIYWVIAGNMEMIGAGYFHRPLKPIFCQLIASRENRPRPDNIMKKRCTASARWGDSYTKYQCGQEATHWHAAFGELCSECATRLRSERVKGIRLIGVEKILPANCQTEQ